MTESVIRKINFFFSMGVPKVVFLDAAGDKRMRFLWYRNCCNEPSENLKALRSMLWQHKIDARIGPPVDFQKTIVEERVRLIQTNNDSLRGVGVYIREDHYVSFRSDLAKMGISF